MNYSQKYDPGAPLTASPDTDATSLIEATRELKGWSITVAGQDVYLVFSGALADDPDDIVPTATNGMTVPAGSVIPLWPIRGHIYVRAAADGAIVNATPLE